MCEDELRAAGYYPAKPEPVRVERFVEKRFRVSVAYDDLPAGVLGYTLFGSDGVTGVHISSVLAEEQSRTSNRRINSTLAHEAGHGLLHSHLFAFSSEGLSLFGGDPDVTTTRILCREPKGRGYGGQWWEVQANMVIGPLLMPRVHVLKAAEPFTRECGSLGGREIIPSSREDAVLCLADVFDVNPAVARIRVDDIFPLGDGQLTL